MRKLLAFTAISAAALLASTSAPAAVQLVNGSGQLTGATGVVVNGTTYDVSFSDGTCSDLFGGIGGCAVGSTFDFTTQAGADAAAQALLDQVLIDGLAGLFDTHPELTFGCGGLTCEILIPFQGGFPFLASTADNGALIDSVGSDARDPDSNFAISNLVTFALFTPAAAAAVPEPASWAMMLLGFGAVGLAMRRRKRITLGLPRTA
jgi:hypothetical protein